MNTENSKSIITFNKPTQPLLYNADNKQEHYIVGAMGAILPIILKDNCNRQELSVADTMSPILPKKLKDSYNKNEQSMSKYIKSYFYKKNTL